MRDVAAFAGFTQPISFDGLGQDNGGRSGMIQRALVGVVDLQRIVTAAPQRAHFFVRQVLHQLQQFGIFAEKLLAGVGAAFGFEILIFAVDGLVHPLDEQAGGVAGEKVVPTAAPHHLDHVPSGAAEVSFELGDDLAVAANRPVQPLQIAVHHKDQVVQLFAGGQRNCAQRFRFVGFAVAQKGPNLSRRYGYDAAVLQVPHEARLIDRIDRAQSHRYGGKLPEVRHQPGMRIGREAGMLPQFVPEVFQMLLIQTAFQIGASVLAR